MRFNSFVHSLYMLTKRIIVHYWKYPCRRKTLNVCNVLLKSNINFKSGLLESMLPHSLVLLDSWSGIILYNGKFLWYVKKSNTIPKSIWYITSKGNTAWQIQSFALKSLKIAWSLIALFWPGFTQGVSLGSILTESQFARQWYLLLIVSRRFLHLAEINEYGLMDNRRK